MAKPQAELFPQPVELWVITGYSGAGKSEAIAAFEDSGFFCVDNLPPRMIGSLGELFRHEGSVKHAAVVTDVRGRDYFDDLDAVLSELDRDGLEMKLLFLEAGEEALQDRFKETRRRHPLAPEGRVIDGIRAEREVLGPLRERADVVMDTSDLTGAMLRRRIATELLGPKDERRRLALTLLTFGFKNGPPRDADLMFDVRFLPNPHYREDLRPLTGMDQAVVDHVEAGELAEEFYRRVLSLFDFLLPAYVAEGKSHLTIAIGCTGGRHRSITVANRIARHIGERDEIALRVVHRDTRLD